jgi:multiple sugar transport system substrate-binding protein
MAQPRPADARPPMKQGSIMKRAIGILAVGALAAAALAGCSSAGSGGDKTIKVAYETFGAFTQMDTQMKSVKNDYYTKLALMNRSASTAPDVLYEDTFLIKSDAQAGYLAPLDSYVARWKDWSQFPANAKTAGQGVDGKLYGVSMGTDTRALWYNKALLTKAGITVPWQPKTWSDLLDAAKKIKEAEPGVVPFNIYSGKAQGEASVMQGLEMLLYGTKDTLFDSAKKKWIVNSKGFRDSLDFVRQVYAEGLAPTPQQALDVTIGTTIFTDWIPNSKLAIALDGSWQSGTWLSTGGKPWPEWSTVMGVTPMPTQHGQAPGSTSMSGGWTLAMGSKSKNKDATWDFIKLALDQKNSKGYDIAASQIPVRADVTNDPEYSKSNPTAKFFSDQVKVTHFRPADSDYVKISNAIQVAMESVMTGQQSTAQASAAYDTAVTAAVGAKNTLSGK